MGSKRSFDDAADELPRCAKDRQRSALAASQDCVLHMAALTPLYPSDDDANAVLKNSEATPGSQPQEQLQLSTQQQEHCCLSHHSSNNQHKEVDDSEFGDSAADVVSSRTPAEPVSLTPSRLASSMRMFDQQHTLPSCSKPLGTDSDCDGSNTTDQGPQQSVAGDSSMQSVLDLMNLVQQHRQEIAEIPQLANMEDLLDDALTDTTTALNLALQAMSLATSICSASNTQVEAADQALEHAEQALHTTVQKLAIAQSLVLRKVDQVQAEGTVLPEAAAALAADLAAAVGHQTAADGSLQD